MILPVYCQLADAASANKTYDVALPSGSEWRLESATYIPDSDGAVAVAGTDYRTISVKQGSTSLASINTNTGGTAFVANSANALTVSGGTSREFTGGTDTVKIDSAATGSGKVAKGVVVLTFKQMQAKSYPS